MQREVDKLRAAEQKARADAEEAKRKYAAATVKARTRASRQLELERKRNADRLRRHQDTARKLQARIQDLEHQIKFGETAQTEGLLEEKALLAFLKDNFENDSFDHVGKGGDIIHDVLDHTGAKAGRILYEVKRVTEWSGSHVKQCAEACVSREADIAILVTNRFPAKQPHYFVERGVLIISPLAVLPLVHTAREGLLNIHGLRVSGDQKKRAVRAVYDYLAGGQYTGHMRHVAQHFADLAALLDKERHNHQKVWDARLHHYQGIVTGVGAIHDRLRGLLTPIADGDVPLPPAAKKFLPQFATPRPPAGARLDN